MNEDKYVYKIFINEDLQRSRINNIPRTYESVDGILGHSYFTRKFPAAVGEYRHFKFRSKPTPEYCVKITSSNDSSCGNHPKASASWHGGAIELLYNDEVVGTLPTRGQELEYCRPLDETKTDDFYKFQSTTSDGVCITSLTTCARGHNYNSCSEVLVGSNDDQSTFWLDQDDAHCTDNSMSGASLTLQNGAIYHSECKNDIIRANILEFEDVTVHPNYDVSVDLNLEPNTNTGWSNVLGFQAAGTDPTYVNGKVTLGARIPMVLLKSGRFLKCSTF